MAKLRMTTSTAPVNIAVVKYWGKRDEDLILPSNDSLSVTLSSEEMHAKTTVACGPSLQSDRLWLNGKEDEGASANRRLLNCLSGARAMARERGSELAGWKVHVCSENNFPTAAGLASSAAGYACLVHALCSLYNLDSDASVDLSALARLGSGSACRSVHGGFVEWQMGKREDGKDSTAKQLWNREHWPELRVLILVASDSRKKVPSSVGMRLSARNSELFRHRVEKCVPERMRQMKEAIGKRDFSSFAALSMRDSNQLHAVCLDTTPPCVYMNDVSHAVQELVHRINEVARKNIVAYTFDAGPNACLFVLEEDLGRVASAVLKHFPPPTETTGEEDSYIKGRKLPKMPDCPDDLGLPVWSPGALRYVIHTSVGDGPKTLAKDEFNLMGEEGGSEFQHLLSAKDALPRRILD